MARIIFVSGGIGAGKSSSCLYVLENAKARCMRTGGIVSPRRIVGGELLGYDGLDCATGERFPLAVLPGTVQGTDWQREGGTRYLFSRSGFKRANAVLEGLPSNAPDIAFVDEVGKLEVAGKGIYPGLRALADSLARMESILVCACRTSALGWAFRVFDREIPRAKWSPGKPEELWQLVEGLLA